MTRQPNGTTEEQGWTEQRPGGRRAGPLADDRRRRAVEALPEGSVPVELADLATDVAADEDGLDPGDGATVQRVAVTLHHVHLPKLDEMGVVDYEADAHRVFP